MNCACRIIENLGDIIETAMEPMEKHRSRLERKEAIETFQVREHQITAKGFVEFGLYRAPSDQHAGRRLITNQSGNSLKGRLYALVPA